MTQSPCQICCILQARVWTLVLWEGGCTPGACASLCAPYTNSEVSCSLVSALCAKLYEGSKAATLSLIRLGELENYLYDPEFIDKLGPEKLKGKKLVRLVFETAQSFSDLVRKLTGMMAAEAIRMIDSSCITELHRGILRCAYTQPLSAKIVLLAKLTSEYNTYATAGEFLQAYLDSPDSTLDGDDLIPLLLGVLRDEEVRDLSGDRSDLLRPLPENIVDEVRDEWVRLGLNQATGDTDDSEADDEGNLRDFVVDDEHVSYSSSSSASEGDKNEDRDESSAAQLQQQRHDSDADVEVEDVSPAPQPKRRGKLRRKASVASSVDAWSPPSSSPAGSGNRPVPAVPPQKAKTAQQQPSKAHHALLSAFDELAGEDDAAVSSSSSSGLLGGKSAVSAQRQGQGQGQGQGVASRKRAASASSASNEEDEEEEEDANVRFLTKAAASASTGRQGIAQAAANGQHATQPSTSAGGTNAAPNRKQKRAESRAAKRARYVEDMANG